MARKTGFIGMGNMGYAILNGLLKKQSSESLLFTDINADRMKQVSKETGVAYVENNVECADKADIIVLAVKPQYYDGVLKDIANIVRPEKIIISIAPGITVDYLKSKIGIDARIVRAMPNTPALLGEGMTGVCYDAALFDDEEKNIIKDFFESFGRMQLVEEKLMSAVVCVSGSSPAYAYMFIEALADSAVKYGLPRNTAYLMAAQTLLGSAKMVLETGKHPGELKDMVCSPGGTTIAAVAALEEWGFRNSIIKAADECFKKAENIK